MKTLVWSLPTRIFHWLLTVGFAVAYILGDYDELQNYHFAFGAFVGVLILFRLFYGLFGPKYSHFRDFPIGAGQLIEFVKTFFSKTKVYVGHNPAASIVMLSIFVIGILCSISGYLMYATENQVLNFAGGKDFLEDTHKVLANLFLGLVGIHLLGVFTDVVFHGKTGTLLSIFNGYKNVDSENTDLTRYQKFFSVLWFIVPFVFFLLILWITSKQND